MLEKEIKTERLIIKSPQMDDAVELTELINDKSVVKWLSDIPFPYTVRHAEEFIERSQEKALKNESYNFMIFQNNKMLGGIGLTEFRNQSCELGYWLGKKYWIWIRHRSGDRHVGFWIYSAKPNRDLCFL